MCYIKKIQILLIALPILSFSQPMFYADSVEINYIKKHCNDESKIKATELLDKYRNVQMDNKFDITLKSYFEILQYTDCEKYNDLLESLWLENKVISDRFFRKEYLNNKTNYSNLLIGFNSPQDFRFANDGNDNFTLDQGINNELWFKILRYIKNESEIDFKISVEKNIAQLSGDDLLNFIVVIKENFDLEEFEKDLIKKIQAVRYPYDLKFLINELIVNKKNYPIIEQTLNEKKNIWDWGNWSKYYWVLIKKHDFNIENESYFSVNKKGEKIYDIDEFISYYTNKGEIGSFPIVSIDYGLNYSFRKDYNSLKEFLETLNIQDIQVQKSAETVKLYGSSGKDGFLKITTRNN